MSKTPKLYTIPAGFSFVDMMARGVLDMTGGDQSAIAAYQILLPTRRGCRSLRDAFLRQTGGKPLLLPRMHPVGEVDAEELMLSMAKEMGEQDVLLPPAMPATQRLFLLCRLIAGQGKSRSIAQDMELAKALSRLLDQTYTEDLNLQDLPRLVDGTKFSDHWQISLDFLSLISHHWPKILAEEGYIDAADRRNRLIKALAQHWENAPPDHPVIAAGSTGSIPAVARLLKTISFMPHGMVVLPGLDLGMDEEGWTAIEDTHPQATLKNLLQFIPAQRGEVDVWPACSKNLDKKADIRAFSGEIMRPASTTKAWQNLAQNRAFEPNNLCIERYDCATPQEEAFVAAMALRRTLEDPKKRCALITPDRTLARRVAAACRRWGIEVDDSAGERLSDSAAGMYIRLLLQAVMEDLRPVALLDFCKHNLCRPDYSDWRGAIRTLDRVAMRGPFFQGGRDGYTKKMDALKDRTKNAKDYGDCAKTLSFVLDGFGPLLPVQATDHRPLEDWVTAHIKACEYFCPENLLWSGPAGEAAAQFFTDLLQQNSPLPPIALHDYAEILTGLMGMVSVRTPYGVHPRVLILGQLEARLLEVDVMVLSGLNEGTWPGTPSPDPWMSRPMRADFGLPPPERSIGLSAHDFAQSLCADEVVLTRALREDGAPTVPSRWLSRMDTVLAACGVDGGLTQNRPSLLLQVRMMDEVSGERPAPLKRPAPKPPVSARPRALSVTRVEEWLKDPYSLYARSILRLKPLDDLEQDLDAAMRGTLLHDALAALFEDGPPDHLAQKFLKLCEDAMADLGVEGHVRVFWAGRLKKIGAWLEAQQNEQVSNDQKTWVEKQGILTLPGPLGDFTLTCRADRMDVGMDGKNVRILDYKSGGSFTQKGMENGTHPQLPLEAMILQDGGFEGIGPKNVDELAYWILNGSEDGGKIIAIKDAAKISAAITAAKDGLQALIARFDDENTPYLSLPRPHKAPKYNDFEHLSRVKEWTALDDGDEEFEEGFAA